MVETVVSDTSRGWDVFERGYSTLHVAAAPCEAGGVQISIWITRTAWNTLLPEVVDVASIPAAFKISRGVIAVSVPDVEVNLYFRVISGFARNCEGPNGSLRGRRF